MEAGDVEKVSIFMRGWMCLKGFLLKLQGEVYEIARLTTKVARDDPRRLIHSLKVGLAVSLVSLFYYLKPLFSSTFGSFAMWAVMTVVVVFEFSVGATIGKGLNRGLATLIGGVLGLGAHHLASLTGNNNEPILIGLFVFLQAVVSTFVRFLPKVKARYDYGMVIFILTFCLISMSGFRTDEIVELAKERLSTILIGASTSVVVSIFVCPVWAGKDLHMLVARNMDELGCFFEGLMNEFSSAESGRPSVARLNNILVDSKGSEETLAIFARWEPGHGRFMYRHPWKQYLKIGNLIRHCVSRVYTLSAYLASINQAPQQVEGEIHEALSRMSSESGKALKQVAFSLETMTTCSNPHIRKMKIALKNLKSLLIKPDSWEEYCNVLEVISVAALLIDTVSCVEQIADAVNELSSMADFKYRKDGDGVEGENNENLEPGEVRVDEGECLV